MEDLISVIVPIYNVEEYLEKCINSVIQQTYDKLEIILVDDGSTDKSGLICDKYSNLDLRIKVIHKVNGGLSSARNVGLEYSKGSYIYFIDSDDYIDTDMLRILFEALKRTDCKVAISGRYLVDEKENIITEKFTIGKEIIYDSKEAIANLLIWNNLDSAAWDKLYKREIFGDIRYPLGVMSEDYDTTSRLLYNAEKIVHVGLPLYYYRQRNGSITKEGFSKRRLEMIFQVYNLREYVLAIFPDLKDNCSYFVGMHIISLQRIAIKSKNVYKEGLLFLDKECSSEKSTILDCCHFSLIQKIKFVIRKFIVLCKIKFYKE